MKYQSLLGSLGADTTEEVNIDRNDDSDQRDNDDNNESVNVNNNDQNDTEETDRPNH